MAADGTSIKNDIDSDLGGKGYKGIRIMSVITTLKKVVDWVTGVVNGNLSTWYKVGTINTPATNSDAVYHAGKMIVGRTTDDGSGGAIQAASIISDYYVRAKSETEPIFDVYLNLADNVGTNQNTRFGWFRFWASNAAPNRFSAIRGNVGEYSDSIGLSFLVLNGGSLIEKVTILPDGKVGVGTLTPTEALHLIGNALIEGDITAGTIAVPKSFTAYGTFKSYFGSVLRAWKLGGATTVAGPLTLKTTQYITVEIDGTTYKLALVN